jgi:hypothetical protein
LLDSCRRRRRRPGFRIPPAAPRQPTEDCWTRLPDPPGRWLGSVDLRLQWCPTAPPWRWSSLAWTSRRMREWGSRKCREQQWPPHMLQWRPVACRPWSRRLLPDPAFGLPRVREGRGSQARTDLQPASSWPTASEHHRRSFWPSASESRAPTPSCSIPHRGKPSRQSNPCSSADTRIPKGPSRPDCHTIDSSRLVTSRNACKSRLRHRSRKPEVAGSSPAAPVAVAAS